MNLVRSSSCLSLISFIGLLIIAPPLEGAEELPWRLKTIDPASFLLAGLAFGPDGLPTIAYASNAGLLLTRYDGSTWSSVTVDSPPYGVWGAHFAIGPDGRPAIAYGAGTEIVNDPEWGNAPVGPLRCAQLEGASWNVTTVAAQSSANHALAIGPDGHPAIAYDHGDVHLARFNGTSWSSSLVDTAAFQPSLAFAPNGWPAIAYSKVVMEDVYPDHHHELRFTRFNGTTWNIVSVDAPGIGGVLPSLAFGPDGHPAIAYLEVVNETQYRLRYAHFDGTRWSVVTIGPANDGPAPSLAFGPDGNPAIAHYSTFAQFDGSTWRVVTFDAAGARSSRLAFGPDGQPAIAYVGTGFNNDGLRLAQRYVPPPQITTSPQPQAAIAGGQATLSVNATGFDLTYQWQRNGVDIPGATGTTYAIASAQIFHAGTYTVVVTNSGGSVMSTATTIEVEAPPPSSARLLNVSNRGFCGSGNEVLIAGFVVSAESAQTLLVRVVGPTLETVGGLTGVLADPQLTIYRHENGTDTPLLSNDDWGSGADAETTAAMSAQVGAFPLPAGSKDAAFVVTLPPGVYTAVASGVGGATGTALVEVYEAP